MYQFWLVLSPKKIIRVHTVAYNIKFKFCTNSCAHESFTLYNDCCTFCSQFDHRISSLESQKLTYRKVASSRPVHRGAFCQFPFRWIYYYGSIKSTGKKTGKTHLCAVYNSILRFAKALGCYSIGLIKHWVAKALGC